MRYPVEHIRIYLETKAPKLHGLENQNKWQLQTPAAGLFLYSIWPLAFIERAEASEERSSETGRFWRKIRQVLLPRISPALIWRAWQFCAVNGNDFTERLIKSVRTAEGSDLCRGHSGLFWQKPSPDSLRSFSRGLFWYVNQLCGSIGSEVMERFTKIGFRKNFLSNWQRE